MDLAEVIENDIPKYKKKSRKKGQPRADHKHEYKKVVVHSFIDSPFQQGIKNEYQDIHEVCMICGRIGRLISSGLFGFDDSKYNMQDIEHWYVEDYFDKFAKKL